MCFHLPGLSSKCQKMSFTINTDARAHFAAKANSQLFQTHKTLMFQSGITEGALINDYLTTKVLYT